MLEAPKLVTWAPRITLLDYAAWRGRDPHMNALLNAGANPSCGIVPATAFDKLPRPYAAWLAKVAAQMRRAGFAASEGLPNLEELCVCGAPGSFAFSPCRHPCCAPCVWRPFEAVDGSAATCVPELLCPACQTTYELEIKSGPAKGEDSRGSTVVELAPQVAHQWRLGQALECFRGCLTWLEPRHVRDTRMRRARCAASLAKWRALPEHMPSTLDEWAQLRLGAGEAFPAGCADKDGDGAATQGKLKLGPFRAMDVNECAATRLGLTRSQRAEHFRRASERGDLRRLEALLEAGADLEHADEYGQTPLLIAAWRGHTQVVEALLRWGAQAHRRSNDGSTPLVAAAAAGHQAVLQVLGSATSTSWALPAPLASSACCLWKALMRSRCGQEASLAPPKVTVIRGAPAAAGGQQGQAGRACYVDGAFSEAFLLHLEALWRSLPVAPREEELGGGAAAAAPGRSAQARKRLLSRGERRGDRSRQGAAPRRSYFCDVSGWVCRELAEALRRSSSGRSGLPCGEGEGEGEVSVPCEAAYTHMRFLHYAEVGGYLAPHVDLSRTDALTAKRSTHTFLLYLGGGPDGGGETVLLQRLDAASPALAAVAPARGRLFVFPHEWPHKALPVARPPKLLLRGEMR